MEPADAEADRVHACFSFRAGARVRLTLMSRVMEFSLPAALFMATASTPRGEMIEQGPFFAILCVAMLVPYLLWFIVATRY
jgi:hypothetical protein